MNPECTKCGRRYETALDCGHEPVIGGFCHGCLEDELTALRERAEAAEAVVGAAFSLTGDDDDSTVWNNTLSPLTNETWKAIHEILLARKQKGGA